MQGISSNNVLVNVKKSNLNIKLIATDVDGTLLKNDVTFSNRAKFAIKKAHEFNIPTILATGKAIGPWTNKVFPKLPKLLPTVFMQGCVICDENMNVIHEITLPETVLKKALDFGHEHDLTVTFYSKNRIFCEKLNSHTELIKFLMEPSPEKVNSLEDYIKNNKINKVVLFDNDEKMKKIKPLVKQHFSKIAEVTTALGNITEILPLNSGKWQGLYWLLNKMKIAPENVMAIGDGENDLNMLKNVGLSVAVENAPENIKSQVDAVVPSNNEDGFAVAIEKFVLNY